MFEAFNFSVEEIKLAPEEFEYFRNKIHELTGISLTKAKATLVQTRLRSRILEHGFKSFAEYKNYLAPLPTDHGEWQSFINLLTTNKTDWFREPEHFDYITEVFLPKWMKLKKKELKVWCAASSTGEEPYTISMVLADALKGTGISYSIFASDIDTKVLAVAKNGVYPKELLHQVPENYQSSFSHGTQDISDWMKVKNEIKKNVTFGQINLTQGPYPMKEEYDLILCRNVLIYFNPETIIQVLKNLNAAAHKEGVLIVSHTESFQEIKNVWKYIRPSIYYKGTLLK